MRADVTDSVACGLAELDDRGTIVDANVTFARWTGLSPSELAGKNVSELVVPAAAEETLGRVPMPGLRTIVHVDGSGRPVLVDESVDEVAGRRFLTLMDAVAQDAYTHEIAGQNALTQRTQTRLELVIATSIAFAAVHTEVELAAVLSETAEKAYVAEESVVFLLDEHDNFTLVAGRNPFSELVDEQLLARQALNLRTVVKVSGLEEAYAISPSVGRGFERAGMHAMIIAPIHQGDQPLGILAAFFYHPRTFDDQASPLADALSGQAAQAITNLRLQARLQHAAMHDDTTGLPNRRLLEEHLDERVRHPASHLAVLFVDLDGFKEVNDRLGHHVGDQLLSEVGRRLQDGMRDGDVVARYGGDEFVVVCEVSSPNAAAELAERLRSSIAAPYQVPLEGLGIAASIGLAVDETARHLYSADRLLRSADQAMYRAKSAGGNRVVVAEVGSPGTSPLD